MKMKTVAVYLAVFLAGVMLANRVRNLPGGKSLPTL